MRSGIGGSGAAKSWCGIFIMSACFLTGALLAGEGEPIHSLPPAEAANPLPFLIQGEEFLRPSIRAMQADDFDNPAFPLVEAAEASWSKPTTPGGKSCKDCHGGGDKNLLKGAAAAYPKYAPDLKAVITLQTRINNCRKTYLGEPAIAEGNSRMIGMTAYLRWLVAGLPLPSMLQGRMQRFSSADASSIKQNWDASRFPARSATMRSLARNSGRIR